MYGKNSETGQKFAMRCVNCTIRSRYSVSRPVSSSQTGLRHAG